MSRRILIVDDEEILLRTFTRLLERSGYEVYGVKSGEQGLLMAGAELFDLVLCDVMMPGMSGFKTAAAIRDLSTRQFDAAPALILMTGLRERGVEEKIAALSPNATLWKPFGAFDLLHTVNLVLKVPLMV